MAKRLTKEQRDKIAKAALYQRVADIVYGAMGQVIGDDELIDPVTLSRAIPVMKAMWLHPEKKYLWEPQNLHQFCDINSIAKFLFDVGVRVSTGK